MANIGRVNDGNYVRLSVIDTGTSRQPTLAALPSRSSRQEASARELASDFRWCTASPRSELGGGITMVSERWDAGPPELWLPVSLDPA
jgi:hypothetical protein